MGWRWSVVAFRRHAKASSMSESDEGLYWILKNDGWWRNFWRLSRRAGEIQKYTGSARARKKPWNVEFQGFMRIAGYYCLQLFVLNPTRVFPSILKSTNVKKTNSSVPMRYRYSEKKVLSALYLWNARYSCVLFILCGNRCGLFHYSFVRNKPDAASYKLLLYENSTV